MESARCKAFVTAAETGSFSKAGEVLGEIDRITAALGKGEADRVKSGLRDVLNNLRPKTEE